MVIVINKEHNDVSDINHIEIELEGEHYSITPGENGSIILRATSYPSAGLSIEPMAGNAVKLRVR